MSIVGESTTAVEWAVVAVLEPRVLVSARQGQNTKQVQWVGILISRRIRLPSQYLPHQTSSRRKDGRAEAFRFEGLGVYPRFSSSSLSSRPDGIVLRYTSLSDIDDTLRCSRLTARVISRSFASSIEIAFTIPVSLFGLHKRCKFLLFRGSRDRREVC